MDFMKLDNSFEENQLKGIFSRVVYAETKGNTLSTPAKEMAYGSSSEQNTSDLPWNAYTLIRIAKGQSAVFVSGDKVISSRAKPGDYAVQGKEDLSSAKVYFVGTDEKSGKMFETHTPLVYHATDAATSVTGEIRMNCAYYFIYRIKNPKVFMKYALVCKGKTVNRQNLETEMNSVFSVCLPELFAQLSADGVPYTDISGCGDRVTEFMKEKLALAWKSSRGIELKEFKFIVTEPNRDDVKVFEEKCALAGEKTAGSSFDSEQFSEEFSAVMKELGKVAGDAMATFGKEMVSLFDELAEQLDKEINSSEAESDEESSDDFDIDSILEGCSTDVMGTWECPELGQTIRFELLYAVIETNGQQVWMGDWEEKEGDDGFDIVVCPTADSLGCYKYFEYHNGDDDEYLAGIILDTGDEKQYVRFVRNAE